MECLEHEGMGTLLQYRMGLGNSEDQLCLLFNFACCLDYNI